MSESAFLTPNMYVARITGISISFLRGYGIKAMILDIDNTLLPAGEDEIPKETQRFVEELKKHFELCLLTNVIWFPKRRRAIQISKRLDIPCTCCNFSNKKPKKWGFLESMKVMQSQSNETAMVGDQVFTDIVGANKLGLFTIAVDPIGRDNIFTIPNRIRERPIRHQFILEPELR